MLPPAAAASAAAPAASASAVPASLACLRALAALASAGRVRAWATVAAATASWALALALVAAGAGRLRWCRVLAPAAAACVVVALAARAWAAVLTRVARRTESSRPSPKKDASAARVVGRVRPEAAGWLRCAAELAHTTPTHPTQGSLIAGHLRRVQARLVDPALARAVAATGRRVRQRAGRAMLAGVGVALVAAAAAPRAAPRLVGAVTGRVQAERSATPLCFDFTVTLAYPAYTGWADWTQTGGDGEIRALAGSRATVQARATGRPRRAWVRTWPAGGDGEAADERAAEVTPDGQVCAQLPLDGDLRYAFVLGAPDGGRAWDRADHALTAVPDAPPEVAIVSPERDVTLAAGANLVVAWRASDDVALAAVHLVVEGANGEVVRLPLTTTPAQAKRRARGRTVVQAASLPLLPDAAATLYVEAQDGHVPPQLGRSAQRRLRLASVRSQRQAALHALQRAADAQVDWLAQEWAEPGAEARGLAAAVGEAGRALDALARAAVAEPNAAVGLREVARQAADHAAQAGAGALPGDAAVRRQRRHVLEQDVLVLDGLQRRGDAVQVRLGAEEVREAGVALRQQLERAASGDPADANQVRRLARGQLQRLRGRMDALLAEVAASKRAQPQRFANVEAEAQSRWQHTLERIEAALAAGDDAAAAKELGHLNQMVEALAEQLNEAEDGEAPGALAATQAELVQLTQAAQKLGAEQNALVGALRQHAANATRARLGGVAPARAWSEVRTHVAGARTVLARAAAALPAAAGHELSVLETALGELALAAGGPAPEAELLLRQLGAAQQQAAALRQRLEAAGVTVATQRAKTSVAENIEQKLAQARARLGPLADGDRPPAPRTALATELAALTQRQGALAARGQALHAKMRALQQRLPMLGAEGGTLLAQAEGAQNAATAALGRGRAAAGTRAATTARERLRAFVDAAEAQAAGAQAAGVPLPMGSDAAGANGTGAGADAQPQAAPGGPPGAPTPAGDQGAGSSGAAAAGPRGPGRAGGAPGAPERGVAGGQPGSGAPGAGPGEGAAAGGGAPNRPGPAPNGPMAPGPGAAQAGASDEVDLPGPTNAGPSPALRRALQRAAQQPAPPRYAPAVQGYYEELLRR